jgi:DNA-binding LacI/PurR family transcriptional regulator
MSRPVDADFHNLLLREVAYLAQVDVRTVQRHLRGAPVRPSSRVRIQRALDRINLPADRQRVDR